MFVEIGLYPGLVSEARLECYRVAILAPSHRGDNSFRGGHTLCAIAELVFLANRFATSTHLTNIMFIRLLYIRLRKPVITEYYMLGVCVPDVFTYQRRPRFYEGRLCIEVIDEFKVGRCNPLFRCFANLMKD